MTVRALREPRTRPAQLRLLQSRRLRIPHLGMWVVYTLVAVIAFFGLIYSRTALDSSAFELQQIEQQISAEQERYQQLRLEVARLSSPERIIPAAEEMGLVLPTDVTPVAASGVVVAEATELEERWTEVKSILSAAP